MATLVAAVSEEILQIENGGTTARILPERGFNCYSLVVDGFDYMHPGPDLFPDGSPTRAGHRSSSRGPTGSLVRDSMARPGVPPSGHRTRHRFQPARIRLSQPLEGAVPPARTTPRSSSRARRRPRGPAGRSAGHLPRRTPGAGRGDRLRRHRGPAVRSRFPSPYLWVPGPFDEWLQCDAAQSWTLAQMIPTGDVVGVDERLDFRIGRTSVRTPR